MLTLLKRLTRLRIAALTALVIVTAGAASSARAPEKAALKELKAGQKAASKNKTAEARVRLEKAIALKPDLAEAWFELGRLQVKEGDPQAADASYERAIQADPKYYEAYVNLAVLARQAKDWPRVLDLTQRLLKINAVDFPLAYLERAIAQYNLGDFAGAEATARAGARLDHYNKFPKFQEVLGLVASTRGDLETAETLLGSYLKREPDDPDAAEAGKVLDSVQKRLATIPRDDDPVFKSDTELALVRFQVSPKRNEFVADLRPEEIEILEDGVPQKTSLFEGGRNYPRSTPVEILLLFDCSGSVQSAGTLNPYIFHENVLDEFENASIAIYAFSGNGSVALRRLIRPTRHPRVLKAAMDAVMAIPPGDTPLFQSVTETIRDAATAGSVVRTLWVVSDGVSTSQGNADMGWSRRAIAAALETGATIYPVLLAGPAVGGEYAESVQRFADLGPETGGYGISVVETQTLLARILREMSARMQFDYVAGFYPASTGQNKSHSVEVVLKSKGRGEIIGGKRILIH